MHILLIDLSFPFVNYEILHPNQNYNTVELLLLHLIFHYERIINIRTDI